MALSQLKKKEYVPEPVDLSDVELSEEFRNYIEELSEKSHNKWMERRVAEGGTLDKYPNLKPWNQLTEKQKDDTRNQFIEQFKFIQEKTLPPTWKKLSINDYLLSEGYIEVASAMAENAHEVWAKNKMENGWIYGPEKSVGKKTTPDLRPYSELSDNDRSYDLDISMNILNFLASKDYVFRAQTCSQ